MGGISMALSQMERRIQHLVCLDWKARDLEADIQTLEFKIMKKKIELAEIEYDREASESHLVDLYLEAENEGHDQKKIAQFIKDAIIRAKRV